MKALLRIQRTGVNAQPAINYILTLKGGQKAERDKDVNARVGSIHISDDLKDVDLSTPVGRKEASERIEAWDIYCKTKHTIKTDKRGNKKRIRCRKREHITISALLGESHAEFEDRLVKSLPQLTKDLGIKTYVLATHIDCDHPHAHLVCEAYAPSIGRGARRHISKTLLNELNNNSWTKEFEAPSVTSPDKCSERSKRYKNKKLQKWDAQKIELAATLHHYAPTYRTGDAGALISIDMPTLTKNFRSVTGELKKSASVKDGKTTLRLVTYQKMLHVLQEDEIFKEKLKSLNALKKPVPKRSVKKTTYTLATPRAVKATIGGVKEVGRVFKLAGGALVDALTVDDTKVDEVDTTVKAPAPKKRKSKAEWKAEQEAAMNAVDKDTGLKVHQLHQLVKEAETKKVSPPPPKKKVAKRKLKFKKSDPNL